MTKQITNYEQKSRHCGLDPQSPENCLNHDFHKIFKMSKINLANPKNLTKIVVQDKKTGMTALIETSATLSLRNFSGSERSRTAGLPRLLRLRSATATRNDDVPFSSYVSRHCGLEEGGFVKTRFYLVLPILTGSTCRNRRHEVEPRTNVKILLSFILFIITITAFSQNENVKMRLDSIVATKHFKIVFFYDEHGNEIEYIHYVWVDTNNTWQGQAKYKYKYDSNNNKTYDLSYTWSYKNNTWINDFKCKYEYDSNGNQILEHSYHKRSDEWEIWDKREYVYDNKGNNILTNGDSYKCKYKYTYDKKGNIIQRNCYSTGFLGNRKVKFTYDNNGNLIFALEHIRDDHGKRKRKFEFAYDSNGNRTSLICYDWDYYQKKDWVGRYKYEYTYDLSYFAKDLIGKIGIMDIF